MARCSTAEHVILYHYGSVFSLPDHPIALSDSFETLHEKTQVLLSFRLTISYLQPTGIILLSCYNSLIQQGCNYWHFTVPFNSMWLDGRWSFLFQLRSTWVQFLIPAQTTNGPESSNIGGPHTVIYATNSWVYHHFQTVEVTGWPTLAEASFLTNWCYQSFCWEILLLSVYRTQRL